MNGHVVRLDTLGPDNWREYRALRLEALRLEPAAFSSTYEDAVDQPDAWWRERLANPRCSTLMARAGEQPIGMVTACRETDGDESGVAMIFGMYVAARYRRQGIGRALLAASIDHLAASPEIVTIRLWVRKTHHPARGLYASLGFAVREDAGEPIPDGEAIMERLVRP